MATSGSVDFSTSRDSIIDFALKKIGVVAEGGAATANQVTDAAVELNMMVKNWQIDGLQLWAKKRAYLFLEKNKTQYDIGPGGDHVTAAYTETEIATAGSEDDTTIEVDSISGISASDNIGIELDDGTMQWTTVSGSPSGTTVTLATGLTDDVAVDNKVYVYTTKIDRPLRILDIFRRNESNVDVSVDKISLSEFTELSNKTSDGKVTQVAFVPSLTTAQLHVWNQSDTVTDQLVFWYHRPFEDFDAAGDEPDFPQEWYMVIGYELAALLADTYAIPSNLARRIALKAAMLKADAEDWDQEDASIFFEPDMDWPRRK